MLEKLTGDCFAWGEVIVGHERTTLSVQWRLAVSGCEGEPKTALSHDKTKPESIGLTQL
jgi:hypothetical protein